MNVIITDGGDRQGTYGSYHIYGDNGNLLYSKTSYWGIGDHNQAEYWSVYFALKKAHELKLRNILIFTDSETVELQVKGERPLHQPYLRKVRKSIFKELENFDSWEIRKVDRALIYSFLRH